MQRDDGAQGRGAPVLDRARLGGTARPCDASKRGVSSQFSGLLPVGSLRQTQPTLFIAPSTFLFLPGLRMLVSHTGNPTSLTDVESFTVTLLLCCKPSSVLIPLSNHSQLEICVLGCYFKPDCSGELCLSTVVPPYLFGVHSRTLSGCQKTQIVPNPVYAIYFSHTHRSFYLKEALYSFSLAYLNCQHCYSCALRP